MNATATIAQRHVKHENQRTMTNEKANHISTNTINVWPSLQSYTKYLAYTSSNCAPFASFHHFKYANEIYNNNPLKIYTELHFQFQIQCSIFTWKAENSIYSLRT